VQSTEIVFVINYLLGEYSARHRTVVSSNQWSSTRPSAEPWFPTTALWLGITSGCQLLCGPWNAFSMEKNMGCL